MEGAVARAVELLLHGLGRFVEERLKAQYPNDWQTKLYRDGSLSGSRLLDVVDRYWVLVFEDSSLGKEGDATRAVVRRLHDLVETVEQRKPQTEAKENRLLANVKYILRECNVPEASLAEELNPSSAATAPNAKPKKKSRATSCQVPHKDAGTPQAKPKRKPQLDNDQEMAMDEDSNDFSVAVPQAPVQQVQIPPPTMSNQQHFHMAEGTSHYQTAHQIQQEPSVMYHEPAPRVEMTPSASDSPNRLLFVLDGPNVAYRHGFGQFSAKGLLCAYRFFHQNGYDCVIVMPDGKLSLDMMKETDASMIADTNEVTIALRNLVLGGHLFMTPLEDYDDSYVLHFAMSRGGIVVSNDRYRDHLEQGKARGIEFFAMLESYLNKCRLSFAFRKDEFIPSPDFDVEQARTECKHIVNDYRQILGASGFQAIVGT